MWRSLLLGVVLAGVLSAAAFARDPWDPHTSINKSDQAAATAALLTVADLGPGWIGGPQAATSFKAPTCPAQRPNDGDLTVTGHTQSQFSNGNGGIQVTADVEVFPNTKQAKARMTRFLQPKIGTCLRYDLDKSVAGTTGVTLLNAARQKFVQVAERTAVFRVPILYKLGKQTVTVDSDFLYFGQGRTEFYVNVVAPSNEEGQLPAFELRLAKLLVKRVVR